MPLKVEAWRSRMTGKSLYGRPLAWNGELHAEAGPYGLPFLNNGPLPLSANHQPEWHSFTHTELCYFQRLCMYCGSRMTGPMVHVRYRYRDYESSGPPGHPTCMLYAVRSCPHVSRDPSAGKGEDVVAYVTVGDIGCVLVFNERGYPDIESTFADGDNMIEPHAVPVTLEQLRSLAREYPER